LFPLKDSIPSRSFPFVNCLIITTNIIVFIYELSLGNKLSIFLLDYGFIPEKFFAPLSIVSIPEKFLPVFTSMFIHGGWLHIIGNMYFLYIFGDNIEDRLGHMRYLFMYIIFGLAAVITQTVLFPEMNMPTVGASGAIAGVMGAYFIFFPHAYIKTLVILFIFVTIIDVPAIIFIGLWFFIQFMSGSLQTMAGSSGGIAWWAHIGGFAAGFVYAACLVSKNSRRRL